MDVGGTSDIVTNIIGSIPVLSTYLFVSHHMYTLLYNKLVFLLLFSDERCYTHLDLLLFDLLYSVNVFLFIT